MTDDTRIDLGIDALGPAEHIGSGAFADVYRAEQLSFRRIVAVKVLRAQVADDEAEARFERECYALGAVSDHPNIVGVHEGGFTRNGRAYLVKDYLPGGSMLDRLERFGVMSPADVTQIGVKIGSALDVAHRAGVLHRDVKPANIMISKSGEPALGDFGIARIEGGHQPRTGPVTTSFLHTAPEVLEGQDATPAADIYSLASTLYELVSGNPPYFSEADDSVWPALKRILSEPVPSPSPFGMSAEFCHLFDRATARNPNLRYRDAGEFVEDLRRINPGSVRDRDDANLRAELRAAAGGRSPEIREPVDLAPEAPFLDHTLGMEPAPTADIGGMSRVEFKARQEPIAPLVAQDATPIGKPDVITVSEIQNLTPLDVRSPKRSGRRMPSPEPSPAQSYFESDWELNDRRRSSSRVGLKALAVVALSISLVALVAFGAFRIAVWGASELRASRAENSVPAATAPTGNDVVQQMLAVPATSSIELIFADAENGPLIAGQSYAPTLSSDLGPGSFLYLVDGQRVSSAEEVSFVMPAGRHVVQAEILTGAGQGITEPIDVFGLENHESTGFQVNLGSAPRSAQQWPILLGIYDQLIVDGHSEVTIGLDDQTSGATWRIFVPNFGSDSAAAEAYCGEFEFSVASQCSVGPALVSQVTE